MSKRFNPDSSKYICSLALLKMSAPATAIITLGFAILYFFTDREQMVLEPLIVSVVSLVGWFYLTSVRYPSLRLVTWLIAVAIYLGLTIGIIQHPAYMAEISLSLSFVLIVLASGGEFVGVAIAAVVITVSTLLLAPSPEVISQGVANSESVSGQKIDLGSLIGFILGFGFGGTAFTYRIFQLHQQVHDSRYQDPLTKLPNRALLEVKLQKYFERFKDNGDIFHILFLDVNDFTRVNNIFGHEAGDRVLMHVGRRLEQACSQYQQLDKDPIEVFRYGGDEFIILVPNAMTTKELKALSASVFEDVRQTYTIDEHEVETSISIGLSTSGGSARNIKELLGFADIAMYTAKKSELQQVLYEDMELSDWDRHFLLQQNLHQALLGDEIYAVYQPVHDAKTKKIAGVEVLARWDSSVLGMVSPEEFIAVAEADGLIHRLGLVFLERGIQQARQWREIDPNFKVMVNVSPYQLKKSQLLDYLIEVLTKEPELAKQLVLEITESVSFSSSEPATLMLQKLKALGLSIALDDYGTGSTSFLNLQQGAFNRLKLDRSLVLALDEGGMSGKVIEAAINSAHSLDLSVTAEGIETEQQFQLMRGMGCDLIQGYWFSKPVSANDIDYMLQSQSA